MVRKKKNIIDERLINLQTKVIDNLNKLCDFDLDIKLNDVITNSCYDFKKGNLSSAFNFEPEIDNSCKEIPKYKSKIVDLIVNNKQKILLDYWFNSYIDMYNVVIHYYKNIKTMDTIKNFKLVVDEFNSMYKSFKDTETKKKKIIKDKNKFIKSYNSLINKKKKTMNDKQKINNLVIQIKETKIKLKEMNILFDEVNKKCTKMTKRKNKEEKKINVMFNYERLRTYVLKNIRDHIQIKSNNNQNDRIRIHVLDTAIKMACASYKSCITNYVEGNIKKFKIKYWRHNRNKKILEVESEFIIGNKMFYKVFGDFTYKYNNEDYILQKETLKIMYVKDINKYYLLISEKINQKDTKSKKYIAIDQGSTPFVACRTNDELISIGSNTSLMVQNYLKRIDNINNANNLTKEEKRKKESKYYLKLKNKIDETHWKTIKYITDNYKYVIIGDLSMKDCSNKKTSKISKENKRIGLMMKFSEFRKRLEYKCLINNIKIEIIDEAYTSKVCSTCGNSKEINGNKEYKCILCNKKRNRDFNSATNMILLKM
jgi:IS605 OrfB family transposase